VIITHRLSQVFINWQSWRFEVCMIPPLTSGAEPWSQSDYDFRSEEGFLEH